MLRSGGSSKKWPKEGTSDFYVVFCNVRKEELCEASACINGNVFSFFIAYVRRRLSSRKKEPENIREAAGSNKDNQGQQIKEKILLIADKNFLKIQTGCSVLAPQEVLIILKLMTTTTPQT